MRLAHWVAIITVVFFIIFNSVFFAKNLFASEDTNTFSQSSYNSQSNSSFDISTYIQDAIESTISGTLNTLTPTEIPESIQSSTNSILPLQEIPTTTQSKERDTVLGIVSLALGALITFQLYLFYKQNSS